MKNTKLKLFLTGLLFTLITSTFVYLGTNWLPEGLKFDVQIWGTVDSWMVYLITLVTAIFIYETLTSQKNVQKDQSRIFRLEELKYLRSIKPDLTCECEIRPAYDQDDEGHILGAWVKIKLETNNRECLGKISVSSINNTNLNRTDFVIKNIGGSYQKDFENLRVDNLNPFTDNNEFNTLQIEIEYLDTDGNTYQKNEQIDFLMVGYNIEKRTTTLNDKLIKTVY